MQPRVALPCEATHMYYNIIAVMMIIIVTVIRSIAETMKPPL